jgi:competence protein ComGC
MFPETQPMQPATLLVKMLLLMLLLLVLLVVTTVAVFPSNSDVLPAGWIAFDGDWVSSQLTTRARRKAKRTSLKMLSKKTALLLLVKESFWFER